MVTVENTGQEPRTWPRLQRTDGVTLALDAGETAEIEGLPDQFDDPYLQVKPATPPSPAPTATQTGDTAL